MYLKSLMLFSLVLFFTGIASAGDETQINQMIEDSSSTVQLEAKTYLIENPIQMKSGVTLQGVTGETTFLLEENTNWDIWVPLIDCTNLENVRVAGITFDMNSDNQEVPYAKGYHNVMYLKGCNNVEVDDCTFINGRGDGARFKSCTNVIVHDNTAKRLGHDGIYVVDCKDVNIYNNRVTTRKNAGIRNWNSVNVRIEGNSIDAQLDGKGGYAGIQIEYSKYFENPNVEISNNVLADTWGPGAQLIAYAQGLEIDKGVCIKQNKFLQCGHSNNIVDTGGVSIKGLDGAEIIDNVGDGCYNAFVYVSSGGDGTIIKDNIIENTKPHVEKNLAGTGAGIVNSAGSNLEVSGNSFSNNANRDTYNVD
jgi:parallel beta-helix repeat protein